MCHTFTHSFRIVHEMEPFLWADSGASFYVKTKGKSNIYMYQLESIHVYLAI